MGLLSRNRNASYACVSVPALAGGGYPSPYACLGRALCHRSKAVLDGRLVSGRLSQQLGVPRHGASEFTVPIRVSAVPILTLSLLLIFISDFDPYRASILSSLGFSSDSTLYVQICYSRLHNWLES